MFGGADFAAKTQGTADGGYQCTSGFAYAVGSRRYWLTAGHCSPQGTTHRLMFTDYGPHFYRYYVGSATGATTFRDGAGSIPYQGAVRGDVALVALAVSASPRIYVGGTDSIQSLPVVATWSRPPAKGDRYCSSGAKTGERCGWKVVSTRSSYKAVGGGTVYPLVKGEKQGQCLLHGDSGDPFYTKDSRGVYAKGIASGAGGGGRDDWGGYLDPCESYFSTVQQAAAAFGGGVVRWG